TRALVGETKGYSLFDLTDPARPAKLATVAAAPPALATFRSGVALVYPMQPTAALPVHFLDAATGRKLWEQTPPTGVGFSTEVSADGRFCVLGNEVVNLPERRVAWTTTDRHGAFSPDSRSLVVHGTSPAITIHDAATGAEQASIPFPPRGATGWLGWLRPPKPGTTVKSVRALDWPALRPALDVRSTAMPLVDGGGRFALTLRSESRGWRVERWDIPQAKPWGRIVGVPVALGVCVVGASVSWRPRRRERP
ncbi:MAG: hypothetical protein ACRC33_13505, partial [Gemmataceae bacterium]